jgi:hypothetical protein
MNPMSENEFQDFLRQAKWSMRSQMDQNEKEHQLSTYPRFDWDPWRRELVFSTAGTPKVVAGIQAVGSLSAKSNTWLWAWANSEYPEPLRQSVLRAKEFGTQHGVLRLIQPRWAAKEADGWDMTAIAFRLNEAKGAFRSPSPDGFTFMLFTDLRAVSDRKRIFGARTCSHVLENDRAILLVSRELDGEVLAVCGAEDDTAETTRDIPLNRLLILDDSLAELADLPDGWIALRESPNDGWVRSQSQ